MKRRNLILILASTTALSALALSAARARDVPKVATGFVANVVCTETFVSGLDPARVFAETTSAMPGTGLISWALDYRVDRARKDVTVTLFGLGRSHAVYRGEGLGCYLDHGGAVADISVPAPDAKAALLPDIAGPSIVAPQTPQLAAALDRAFAEPDKSTLRHTRAIVVMKDGRVVAERYADGIGIDTPLLGFSATKSVISALAGILVRKGALKLHEPVPIAAWQGADDPRRAITLDHLLRHTAGLALGSSLQASLASALEPVNRMKFMESDMAAYAESMPLRVSAGHRMELSRRQHRHPQSRDPSGFRRQRVQNDALRAAGIVRPARHAQRHDRVRRVGQCGRIEPDAGKRARLGALRPALSQ